MEKKINIFYYIGALLIFFATLSGWSTIINLNTMYYPLIVVGIILMIINFLSYRHSLKQFLLVLLLFTVFFYTYIKTGLIIFVINYLLIICAKGINFNKILKIDIACKLFYLISHIIIFFLDLFFELGINNIHQFADSLEYRESLLFTGPNSLSALVFWLVMDYLLLNKDKNVLKKSFLCLIPIIIIYYIANTRTTFYLYIIFLFLVVIKDKSIGKRIINFLQYFLSDILFIISLLLLLFSNYIMSHFNEIFTIINKMLSGRLIHSIRAFDKFGISILAKNGSMNFKQFFIIDNFYVLTIISYGVIIYILLSFLCKYVSKKTCIFYKIIMITSFIYLFSENVCFNGGVCIFICLLGYLFYLNKKRKDEDDNNEKIFNK